MKIIHVVVTYSNNSLLERCIRSIFHTATHHDREVWVINNHSNLWLPDDLRGAVRVLDNQTRPDFSTGHLSRNWNQALINGFVDLNNPAANLLILSQNDSIFAPNYLEPLIDLHNRFDLVTYGAGDNCVSYSPRAVKRVGLWDERFCNIGFQEADYFLRAKKYLGDRASINDSAHGRLHNTVDTSYIIKHNETGSGRKDAAAVASIVHHDQSFRVFQTKWNLTPDYWNATHEVAHEQIMSHIYYPYFEHAVETLVEQRYLVA